MKKAKSNVVVDASNVGSFIIDFEEGNINDEGVIALFQYLLDSGLAWQLQGSYGRLTKQLLDNGYLIKR